MYVMESWKRSISLIKPENLKFLFNATLKTLYQSKRLFLGMFLLFVLFDNDIWKATLGISFPSFDDLRYNIILTIIFIFAWKIRQLLVDRLPDTVRDFNIHFIYWFFIPLFFYPFFKMFAPTFMFSQTFILWAVPFEMFLVFFWCEDKATMKNMILSVFKAFKMYVFNFPFVFVFFIVPMHFFYLIQPALPFLFKYLEEFIMLTYLAFFANFYAKRIYGKFQ